METVYTVLLFASLKDAVAADRITVRVSSSAPLTVAELLAHCGQQYPALAPWLPHVKVAVNCAYADARQQVAAGDEIALLPPVAGGDP
ncbi:MAG: MoaD/ThiS family protein [Armatimonadota bacterium]|nr:MoaD/ThiS family protein [Armatimonadota bacterium]